MTMTSPQLSPLLPCVLLRRTAMAVSRAGLAALFVTLLTAQPATACVRLTAGGCG